MSLRASVLGRQALRYLLVPGINNNNANSTTSAAFISDDLDVRVRVALDVWPPAAYCAVAAQFNEVADCRWRFAVNSTGTLRLDTSQNGAAVVANSSTAVVSTTARREPRWLRATRRGVDGVIKFYTALDTAGEPLWVQLGANVADVAGVLFASTAPITLGSSGNNTSHKATGRILYFDLRNGYDGAGAVVARFDPSKAPNGATRFVSTTGETWTINQTGVTQARITSARYAA